jgi:hypothetical protein
MGERSLRKAEVAVRLRLAPFTFFTLPVFEKKYLLSPEKNVFHLKQMPDH